MKNSMEKEYEALQRNAMWQKFIERINLYRDSLMKDILICELREVDNKRGAINALNFVIGLPGSILRSSDTNKELEGEDNNG